MKYLDLLYYLTYKFGEKLGAKGDAYFISKFPSLKDKAKPENKEIHFGVLLLTLFPFAWLHLTITFDLASFYYFEKPLSVAIKEGNNHEFFRNFGLAISVLQLIIMYLLFYINNRHRKIIKRFDILTYREKKKLGIIYLSILFILFLFTIYLKWFSGIKIY